jgi:hypothetical protein
MADLTGVVVEVDAGPGPATTASAAEVRRWARDAGITVSDKGRVPTHVREAFEAARSSSADPGGHDDQGDQGTV